MSNDIPSLADELEPCAHCGSPAAFGVVTEGGENNPDFGGHFVQCTNEKCHACMGLRFACGDDPRPALRDAWNTRPIEARAGGDALLRDLRAWIKDEAQDKSWVAEDALIARIDEALSHPTPADDALHPATSDLVDRFAVALKEKLAASERKYGWTDEWAKDDWQERCQTSLAEHLEKGDPRDVAAFAAFMWHHGWPTVSAEARTPDDVVEALGEVKTNIAWAEEHYSGPEFFDVAWPEIRKSLDALNTALTASGDAREREAIALLRETHDALDPHIVHNVARGEVREKIGDFLALLDTPPAGDGGGV